ncbi:MAG: hypothetical protein OEY15_08920 [Myxococcales bacterium]|nr:hypothetical protein [Myxococcales bacterium]
MNPELASHIIAIAVSFGVSLPILRQGIRSGDLPAVLLGAAVGFDGIEWLFWTLCVFTPAYETPLGDAFAVVCRIGISAAVICLIFFTRVVFRPRDRAAGVALWLLIAAMVVGLFGSGTVGDWGGSRNDHAWNWIELFAQIAGYGWAAWESLAYHLKLRRRAVRGLADPLLANRLLLWSLYAGMYCTTQIGYGTVLAFYETLTQLDMLLVAFTITGQISLWLAFFPPPLFARWVRAAYAAES